MQETNELQQMKASQLPPGATQVNPEFMNKHLLDFCTKLIQENAALKSIIQQMKGEK